MDGNVHTFKAHLVAKGFTQTYEVDYEETFFPVADIRAIRIILAIVAFYDYEIWQMDVKTAFLNGHLSEDVYMVQPEGVVDPKHPNKVCKLQRSIYGLKQASRSWNKRFDEEINKIGFSQNPDEPCVYLKASGSNVAFLVLYVDDILLMGNSVTMLKEVKSWLCKCFSMKDLGEASYILGIKIIRDRSKRLIALSQSAYLEKILKKFRMKNSKKGYTPMMEKPDYRKSQGAKTPTEVQRMQRVPYASAIGSIMNTKDMILTYGDKPEDEQKVSCYADATEYIVAAEASMKAGWMRKFIDRLGGVMPSNKRPMEMLCDNEPALAIANDNIVDPFTKPMPLNKHFEHAMAIGIIPTSSLIRSGERSIDLNEKLMDDSNQESSIPLYTEITTIVPLDDVVDIHVVDAPPHDQNPIPPIVQQPLRRSERTRRLVAHDDFLTDLNEDDYDLGFSTMASEIHEVMSKFQFKKIEVDQCIYLNMSGSKFFILVVYVNEIILASNDLNMLYETKRSRVILGLSQRAYIDKILKKYNMENCSPTVAPVVKGDKFGAYECPKNKLKQEKMRLMPYASVVGSLTPMGKEHCTAAKKCKDSSRSTSWYIFMLSGGPISWRSHEQELTTTSTMMAEYVACYHAASHAILLRNLVSGLNVTL
ncbi:retrotransposon protein, putative, ty1-copia subclass [Tanacetum coccineum]